MTVPCLRVLFAETGSSETGLILRSFCAEPGLGLHLFLVTKRANLLEALRTFRPDVALVELAFLCPEPRPEPPAEILSLHGEMPEIPVIPFGGPADKESAIIAPGSIDVPQPSAGFQAQANRSGVVWRAPHSPTAAARGPARHSAVSVRLLNLEEFRLRGGNVDAERAQREIAFLLTESIRCSDVIAYVAPGHFVISLQGVDEERLPAIRQRLAKRLLRCGQANSPGLQPQIAVDPEVYSADYLSHTFDPSELMPFVRSSAALAPPTMRIEP